MKYFLPCKILTVVIILAEITTGYSQTTQKQLNLTREIVVKKADEKKQDLGTDKKGKLISVMKSAKSFDGTGKNENITFETQIFVEKISSNSDTFNTIKTVSENPVELKTKTTSKKKGLQREREGTSIEKGRENIKINTSEKGKSLWVQSVLKEAEVRIVLDSVKKEKKVKGISTTILQPILKEGEALKIDSTNNQNFRNRKISVQTIGKKAVAPSFQKEEKEINPVQLQKMNKLDVPFESGAGDETEQVKSAQASYNFIPYQPDGWDSKIVISTVTGTNTSSATINSDETLYLDFAMVNTGTSNYSDTVFLVLYIDDVLREEYYVVGLDALSYVEAQDEEVEPLSAGTHTFKIVVDPENKIEETNESDNEYSRSKTITGTVCVNLTPHQPAGWDDKIVVSTTPGTNTSSTTIYDNQLLYVDLAVFNNGTCDISEAFSFKLYVDGVLEKSYTDEAGLPAGYYDYVEDIEIAPLSEGTHSLRIVADPDNEIEETNENDNEYSRSKTITGTVCVNLTPHQPAGWDDKIVVSTTPGTNTSSTTIYDNQLLYLDLAVFNNGTCDISEAFSFKLYVDGVLEKSYTDEDGLPAGYYDYVEDIEIGPLPAGTHSFKIVADVNNEVEETNENDNEYSCSKTITGTVCVNLTPHQPAEWDDKIVVSTTSGTNTSATTIYDNQTLYVDLAVLNNGTCDISEAFSFKFYVDGVLEKSYTDEDGLPAGYYDYVEDIEIGPLPAGTHSFKIVADVNNEVEETNENDNEYSCSKTITGTVCVNLTPHQPAEWDDKIVISTTSVTNTSATTIYDNQTLYVDLAVFNNGTCDISEAFSFKLYVDGVLEKSYTDENGLPAGYYDYVEDIEIGPLPAGTHSFKIVADANNEIEETNEKDNEYSCSITIVPETEFLLPFWGCLVLDGNDDYADTPDHDELDLGDESGESITVEAWIKFADFSSSDIILKSDAYWLYTDAYTSMGYDFRELGFIVRSGSSNLIVSCGTTIYGGGLWNEGWHHVAGVYDKITGNMGLYMDGEQLDVWNAGAHAINNSSHTLIVGNNFNGCIDEMRISDCARYTSAEYNIPTEPFTTDENTRALWHFNEPLNCEECNDCCKFNNVLYLNKGAYITSVESMNLPGENKPVRLKNYPNPFNDLTTIEFCIPERAHVSIIVYDLMGREINRLVERTYLPGEYTVSWNGRNYSNVQVPHGIYLLQMVAGDDRIMRKLQLCSE
uniref:CARDB domain-containing protein n=1 Tax=uncultured Draconibacterium sp. TaxID=1573823 RepID=UPI003217A0B3